MFKLFGKKIGRKRDTLSGDTLTIRALADVSDASTPHSIAHFLYLPAEENAAAIAGELARLGFIVQELPPEQDEDWLVLARHEIVPTETAIIATRAQLTELAERFGGNYDGWEAEVPQGLPH